VTTPDISAYVDLRIYDITDQEIVDTAIAAAKLNLPGWVPREGNTEVVIMESLALEIAEAIVAINRLPGAVVQALLLLAGVDRDFGIAPIATVTFILGDLLGHSIPGGTRLYLTLDDGSTVTFLVEPPGVDIPPGSDTGTCSVIGDTFTDRANGIAAGTRLIPADPVPFIESVVLATNIADGAAAETDNQWRDRGVARLSRLSDALVLPRHFEAAALEDPDVARAVTIDLFDPTSGHSPGGDPGHITVAVLGPGGATLSTDAKEALRVSLDSRAVAVLEVHVTDAAIVNVNITGQVVPLAGFTWTAVQANVVAAVRAYLDPLNWSYGATIYLNEMISLVDRVDGVDRVVSVQINGSAADYTLTGATSLPKANTVAFTQGP
jgi:uncharacterized phage protein gp47/JayE